MAKSMSIGKTEIKYNAYGYKYSISAKYDENLNVTGFSKKFGKVTEIETLFSIVELELPNVKKDILQKAIDTLVAVGCPMNLVVSMSVSYTAKYDGKTKRYEPDKIKTISVEPYGLVRSGSTDASEIQKAKEFAKNITYFINGLKVYQ